MIGLPRAASWDANLSDNFFFPAFFFYLRAQLGLLITSIRVLTKRATL